MPGKYAHAKKRLARRQANGNNTSKDHQIHSAKSNTHNSAAAAALSTAVSTTHTHTGGRSRAASYLHSHPGIDRSLSATLSAISELERAIAALLLARYEADIARLYSTRLHAVARNRLPKLLGDCVDVSGAPGWAAVNAHSETVKDYFRGAIAMDLRQADERVATESALWSYTALRQFVSP